MLSTLCCLLQVVRPWDISNLEADCYGGKASEDSTSSHKQFRGHDLDRAHSAYMLFYERHTVSGVARDATCSPAKYSAP
jgi:hypothetical protein